MKQRRSFVNLGYKASDYSPRYEDSNGNFSDNFSVETPRGVKSPKSSKNIARISQRESILFTKRNNKLVRKTIEITSGSFNENLILRKSHSINIEQPIELFEKTPEKKIPLTKSKLEKLRSFAFSKNKSSQNIPKDPSSFLFQRRPTKIAHQEMKDVFRRKSCKCRHCGTGGKLDRVATIKQKVNTQHKEEETEKTLEVPVRINTKQTSFANIQNMQKHNSLTTDEKDRSFKDLAHLEGKIYARMSVNLKIINSERLFVNNNIESQKNSAISLKTFTLNLNNSRKSSKITTKKSSFANKIYFHGAMTDRTQNISPLLNKTMSTCKKPSLMKNINNNYSSHLEATTDRSAPWMNEESMDLPEILYMNGSLRTKQIFKSQMKEMQNNIKPEGRMKSPYLASFFNKNNSKQKK